MNIPLSIPSPAGVAPRRALATSSSMLLIPRTTLQPSLTSGFSLKSRARSALVVCRQSRGDWEGDTRDSSGYYDNDGWERQGGRRLGTSEGDRRQERQGAAPRGGRGRGRGRGGRGRGGADGGRSVYLPPRERRPKQYGGTRAEGKRYGDEEACPACQQLLGKYKTKHLAFCCPDLLDPEGWASGDGEMVRKVVRMRHAEESRDWRLMCLRFGWPLSQRAKPMMDGAALMPRQVGERMRMDTEHVTAVVRRELSHIPILPEDAALDVLLEDERVLAVNKPANMGVSPMHRLRTGSLMNRVVHHLGGKEPYLVHRLDLETSGVVLFAKDKEAATLLMEQFENREVAKEYMALCTGPAGVEGEGEGEGPAETFSVDARIGRPKEDDGRARRVISESGQTARTDFVVLRGTPARMSRADLAAAVSGASAGAREAAEAAAAVVEANEANSKKLEPAAVVARAARRTPRAARVTEAPAGGEGGEEGGAADEAGEEEQEQEQEGGPRKYYLVRAKPHTGRTHQIRIHLMHAGLGILGDPLYGTEAAAVIPRLGLHASSLEFINPHTGDTSRAEAPLPQDLAGALEVLGLQ